MKNFIEKASGLVREAVGFEIKTNGLKITRPWYLRIGEKADFVAFFAQKRKTGSQLLAKVFRIEADGEFAVELDHPEVGLPLQKGMGLFIKDYMPIPFPGGDVRIIFNNEDEDMTAIPLFFILDDDGQIQSGNPTDWYYITRSDFEKRITLMVEKIKDFFQPTK